MRYINKESDVVIQLLLKYGPIFDTYKQFSTGHANKTDGEIFEEVANKYKSLKSFGIETFEQFQQLYAAMQGREILASDLTDPNWFKECFKCVINEAEKAK